MKRLLCTAVYVLWRGNHFPTNISLLDHTINFINWDHSLCVGLLQQGAPELVSVWGAEVDQFVVECRQQVVYPHLLPLTVLPELQRQRGEGCPFTLRTTSQLLRLSTVTEDTDICTTALHGRVGQVTYLEGEATIVSTLEALIQRHDLAE